MGRIDNIAPNYDLFKQDQIIFLLTQATKDTLPTAEEYTTDVTEEMWDHFFSEYFGYLKHGHVTEQSQKNYYFNLFKNKVNEFTLKKPNQDNLITEWKTFLTTDIDFEMKAKNPLLWAFRILQDTLYTLEKIIVTKSDAVKIPSKAVELGSEKLANDADAQFSFPSEKTAETIEAVKDGGADPDWAVQFKNNRVKIVRDALRTNRALVQQRINLLTSQASSINTGIQQQSVLLKSISTLYASLVKSVISKR